MTKIKNNLDKKSKQKICFEKQSDLKAAASVCPYKSAGTPNVTENSSSEPVLMRVSEVVQKYPEGSAMVETVNWINNFLGRPHPDLGRRGSVCPFVPMSLEMDSLWMAEVKDADLDLEQITEIITRYRDLFLVTEPTNGSEVMNKAFMLVFPNLGADAALIVDKVQFELKKYFVEMGLMLGEFHANNESPGLRNNEFRPLRSPIPMLAIRHMVDSDLPFLLSSIYPAADRAIFLRSYLVCLGNSLNSSKFGQALEGVIQAEIQKWISNAQLAGTYVETKKNSHSDNNSVSLNL